MLVITNITELVPKNNHLFYKISLSGLMINQTNIQDVVVCAGAKTKTVSLMNSMRTLNKNIRVKIALHQLTE